MASAVETLEWTCPESSTIEVPRPVYEAPTTPLRGQSGFGPHHKYLLSLFHDTPEFKPTLDKEATCKLNVKTILTCRYDSKIKKKVGYGLINLRASAPPRLRAVLPYPLLAYRLYAYMPSFTTYNLSTRILCPKYNLPSF